MRAKAVTGSIATAAGLSCLLLTSACEFAVTDLQTNHLAVMPESVIPRGRVSLCPRRRIAHAITSAMSFMPTRLRTW